MNVCDPDWINKNGDCPCTLCLVKAACDSLCPKANAFLVKSKRIQQAKRGEPTNERFDSL